jgi:4-amino-4-deoxy-L-arabinose transferase-like glycosyltransferase
MPAANNLLFVYLAVITAVTALYFFHFKPEKENYAFVLLSLSSFFLGIYAIFLLPFLNIWDEQFHALVAKNLANDFTQPLLYKTPLLDYDYRNWGGNHIWLHKQPFFLWQMALCIKIFGNTEFSVRLPDALLHGLLVYPIYRIGLIVTKIRTVSLYSSLVFAFSLFPLQLISGYLFTDHNDFQFMSYVTLSIWCFFEFKESGKRFWLIITGFFSGAAILIKWLTGLLVYFTWGIISLFEFSDIKQNCINLLKSLIVTLLFVLPWQIYIRLRFPLEAEFESQLVGKHLFEVIEGHSGNQMFYINALKEYFFNSEYVFYFILVFFTFALIFNINRKLIVSLISSIIFVYLFFTIVKTKMIAFCLIVFPLVLIVSLTGIYYLIEKILQFTGIEKLNKEMAFQFVILIYLTINFNIIKFNKLYDFKSINHGDSKPRIYQAKNVALTLKKMYGESEKVVVFNFNYSNFDSIAAMFYTDFIFYSKFPSPEEVSICLKQNYKVVVISSKNHEKNTFAKEVEVLNKQELSDKAMALGKF